MAANKPRFDLAAAQAAQHVRTSTGCRDAANAFLQFHDPKQIANYITKLFKLLTPSDFSHVQPMYPRFGGVLYGDVYGKIDKYGLWFIKFEFDKQTNTNIMSCHVAEHDISLADGRTLRKAQS
jgi:hypothetical protein